MSLMSDLNLKDQMKKILIIEDDEGKSKELEDFITDEFSPIEIHVAKSFRSGLKSLILGKDLDLVLLDMTMPSFDVSSSEPGGGSPEGFAGRELLAQMRLRAINTPTIVVTMYDAFGEAPNKLSLEQLIQDLHTRYSPPFMGLVYYNSQQEGWRTSLKQLINKKIGNQ